MESISDIKGFQELFGAGTSLLKGTENVSLEELAGKHVGLYFSAHWCPPCRSFTPKLVEFYKNFNASNKKLEIVFISSDNDEKQFSEYYGEMPWLALPFPQRETKTKLAKKFKIEGIPTLVILSPTGETITTDARGEVSSDPKGENFPWTPKTLTEILQGDVFNNKGEKFNISSVFENNTAVGIYFSAHWCGPCRQFTPNLVKTYEAIKSAGKKFEIIFVSSDKDDESYKEYFSTMPWVSIPVKDPRKEQLSTYFSVQGIPTFVILDGKTKKTINKEGRAAVMSDVEGNDFPWQPKPLSVLSPATASSLNEQACLLLLLDRTEESLRKSITAIAENVAKEYVKKWESLDEPPLYFLVGISGDIIARIRDFAALPEDTSLLVLSVPDEQKFVSDLKDKEITEENLKKFVEDFVGGKLEGKTIG